MTTEVPEAAALRRDEMAIVIVGSVKAGFIGGPIGKGMAPAPHLVAICDDSFDFFVNPATQCCRGLQLKS
jgi:hypothetical protein